MVVLHNHGPTNAYISTGYKVAQLIVEKIENCVLTYDVSLYERKTERQNNGFGSTN